METNRKAVEQLRFHRSERLLGSETMLGLKACHVMVIGLGGVGSWAAEMLLRTGVGHLSLVDFDKVCVTNTNRQLHATKATVGDYKAEALAARLQTVNPAADIVPVVRFYNPESEDDLLGMEPDLVLDCIDNLTAKCHLLAKCVARGIPVISSMGAAARIDPTQIRVADLSETRIDPMARAVRKILRQRFQLETGIQTIFSIEEPKEAQSTETPYDNICVCPGGGNNGLHTCDHRNIILGTVGFVTGAFGMAMAGEAIRHLRERIEVTISPRPEPLEAQ
ncbi:MAG: tRNA threonylcarbamoyladenosine dehydratase [Myxococcales bacterium]|nr:tRNA threonylcarbamoyladenosine dehydratase [Myxococcales bacterium]